jgi:succinyl-diaminopimelate desuccinylase
VSSLDPVSLTAELIRCPSVTPDEAGALAVLERALGDLGFACTRLRFETPGTSPVDNLHATLGRGHPHLAFNGHVDVVPPGDLARWSVDPFGGIARDGRLWGRGAADMKSGVAAFIAAVATHLDRHGPPPGAITLLVTADEEGEAINGTARLLAWAAERGERYDACLVGEPTSPERLGDMIKIGRRGSLTGRLTVHGRQGHTAYPDRAENAAHGVVTALQALLAEPLDSGTAWFQPSSLQVTSIDIDNPATNVVPAEARATFNIRYNDRFDQPALEAWLRARLDAAGCRYTLETSSSGDAFLTEPGPLTELVGAAVEAVTGRRPVLSTTGGTSDARFVRRYCPVVELGLVGRTMHQIDEHVAIADILGLIEIYAEVLRRFFDAWRG